MVNKTTVNIIKGNFPRWMIFLIDLTIVILSLTLAYLLRFNFNIPQVEIKTFPLVYSLVLSTRMLSFLVSKIYAGIIRYTSAKDAEKIFLTILSGSLFFVIVNLVNHYILKGPYIIPFSVLIIEYLISTFLLISFRVMVKTLYYEIKNFNKDNKSIIIYGAGESGVIAKRTIDRDAASKYKVIAFVDEDKRKAGKTIEGVRIYHISELEELLQNNDVAHIIVAIQRIKPEKINEIADLALKYNTKVLHVPPVQKWINGELTFKQIKKIKIEDLLGREPIVIDEENIKKSLFSKTILVTGAAGSIGSEITRQLLQYSPKKLILIDRAETPMYELQLEVENTFHAKNVEFILADICEEVRIEKVFETFQPEIVFHAAAYKHVPLMEENPSEAVWVNVRGTKILADLALKHNVKKFVFVSTDKAVNPTNVMGASKRIAEIYCQTLNKLGKTKFVTTRFGNVLGSNGSVIPLFRKQIESGGPVTITHPEITRFFMTIPEACRLVLEAGVMGDGGEIFVFDMGERVKIVDLAKKMIKLSGLTLGKDIQIVFTGLRPGEKLHEELLNNDENTLPTHHPRILKAKVKDCDLQVLKQIDELIALIESQKDFLIVKKMKEIVPEYVSNNSVFVQLD